MTIDVGLDELEKRLDADFPFGRTAPAPVAPAGGEKVAASPKKDADARQILEIERVRALAAGNTRDVEALDRELARLPEAPAGAAFPPTFLNSGNTPPAPPPSVPLDPSTAPNYAGMAAGAGAAVGALGQTPMVQNALDKANPLYKPSAPGAPPVPGIGPVPPVPGPAPLELQQTAVPSARAVPPGQTPGSGYQVSNYAKSLLLDYASGPGALSKEEAARSFSPAESQRILASNLGSSTEILKNHPNAVFDPIKQRVSIESITVPHPITGEPVLLPASMQKHPMSSTPMLLPEEHSVRALQADVDSMRHEENRQKIITQNDERKARNTENARLYKIAVERAKVAHQAAEATHQAGEAAKQAAHQQAEATRVAQDQAREQKSKGLGGRALPMAMGATTQGLSGLNIYNRGQEAYNALKKLDIPQAVLNAGSAAGSALDLASPYLKGIPAGVAKFLSPAGAAAGATSDLYGDFQKGDIGSMIAHGALIPASYLAAISSGPFAPLVGPAVYTAGDALIRNRQAIADAAKRGVARVAPGLASVGN